MITICEGVLEDRESLLRLMNSQENFNSQEKEVAAEVIDDALSKKDKEYLVLVAHTADGEVVGFLCYGLIPLTENSYDLYWIAVDPRKGKLGIGSLMLQEMEKKLRGRNAVVYIDTSSTDSYQKARNFYKKNGYSTACELKDFYRTGDHKLVFRKEL